MTNKFRFLVFNLGFDVLLSLGGIYFLGLAAVLGVAALTESVPYLLALVVLGLAAICAGVGFAVLWVVLPKFQTDLRFLAENGLPND